jgi:hypothetical protein
MAKSTRFLFWLAILVDYGGGLRAGLFFAAVFLLVTGQWFQGFGCLLTLLVWQMSNILVRLDSIRDSLRGFTDSDVLSALWNTSKEGLPEHKGLAEILAVLKSLQTSLVDSRSEPMERS